MSPTFRPVRCDHEAVSQLVRTYVVQQCDVAAAVAAFSKYVDDSYAGSPLCRNTLRKRRQLSGRCLIRTSPPLPRHAQRYLQAYLPSAGFEFAKTFRYRAARRRRAAALGSDESSARDGYGAAPERTDLSVVALRAFQADETLTYCTAALKDLTRAEDEALREEAARAREITSHDGTRAPQRDFSVIRSSSRQCSQLLLGPARFINHDCEPNAEFRRSGHQLSIRCLRPIQRNEEITTYYGDNYFEAGNKECMCASCERRQRGYFAPATEDTRSQGADSPSTPSGESDDARQLRSHSAQQAAAAREARPDCPPDQMILNQVDVDASGPLCKCLTCQATFRAPEKWWTPDECPRCERHYKLFKCDWPARSATPTPAASSARRRKEAPAGPAPAKRRRATTPSSPAPVPPRASSSPVKLSPARQVRAGSEDNDSMDAEVRPPSRRRRFEWHSDDSDEAPPTSRLGPRILGPAASTDALALYWGAPEGERRRRRPASTAVTVLSKPGPSRSSAPPQDRPSATRVASPLSAPTGRALTSQSSAPRAGETLSSPLSDVQTEPASPPRTALPPKRAKAAARVRQLPTPPPSQQRGSQEPTPPSPERHDEPAAVPRAAVIATEGPARTSVSNLALFWSGGVEGRTRQQARQARGDAAAAKPVFAAAARAPSARKGRAGHRRTVSSEPVSGSDGRASSVPPPSAMKAESCVPAPGLNAVDGLRGSAPAADSGASSLGAPLKASATPPPAASRDASSTSFSAPPGAGVPSLPRLPAPPLRPSSPGQPPPPGVRQPIRRNLRWGSGKTSLSRPLPPVTPPAQGAWPAIKQEPVLPSSAAEARSPVPPHARPSPV